ncbi:MAG: ATP-binding protein [Bacteroidales bacterium]
MESSLFRFNPWWEQKHNFSIIDRPKYRSLLTESLGNDQIILLTGLRRIGKTSLMRLSILWLIDQLKIDPKYIFYVSLDDYTLKEASILNIIDAYRKIQQIRYDEKIYVFLDEVAYKQDFALQLKNLHDSQHVKVFAASSSSSLLVAGKHHITGRNKIIEVLPLDFKEYLQFKKINISKANPHLFEIEFENFLKTGGIPQYVTEYDPAYIHELVDDVIMKDIAAVNAIRQPKVLKDLFLMLMERAGKQVSLNKLAKLLGISVDTVARYFDLFVKAYLIYPVDRYGKTNERLLSPKKIYAPDTGIRVHYTGFRDKGSLFENYVFLKLKSFQPEYLYQDQTELDFRLQSGQVVEAKYHNEPLSEKQQKLWETFEPAKRHIVRNEGDIQQVLEAIKSSKPE